jgi:DNA ligase-1
MLASPAEDAADDLARLGPTVWVEDKYDGIRAQLHRRGSEVRLYSRDLHDISGQFPEIVEAARPLDWDGILDGEILAYADGHVLPFLTLQAGSAARSPRPRSRPRCRWRTSPSTCWRSGRGPNDSRQRPLRRAAQRRNGRPRQRAAAAISLRRSCRCRSCHSAGRAPRPPRGAGPADRGLGRPVRALASGDGRFGRGARPVFDEARARRNEGLMVKDPQSGYSPGRRGLGWLKMKRALATLDCVVVGVEPATASATASCRTTRSPSATNRAIGWSRSARPTRA